MKRSIALVVYILTLTVILAAGAAARTVLPAESMSDQSEYRSRSGEFDKARFAAEVLRLINAERAAAGLDILSESCELDQAAEKRSREIAVSFSHTRPDGSSCFTALQQAGAVYTKAGENLAIGQTTAEQAAAEWLASPAHLRNIMDPDFRQTGIAVRESTDKTAGLAWTQLFTD